MLLVQKFLRTKSLQDLVVEHAVNSRIHEHKFSLNYDQIGARDSDLLAQQCRALILRKADGSLVRDDEPLGDTVVLQRSFCRFFNQGQEAAAPIDLNHPETRIFEKLDGSLLGVYWDDIREEWHTSTRSVPEADLPLGKGSTLTFRTLFEKALFETTRQTFGQWTSGLDKTKTYLFELCTPYNLVVVKHKIFSITLIGCRDTLTGFEYFPAEISHQIDVPAVPAFRFSHHDELFQFVRGRSGLEYEGIVACQQIEPGKFLRLKVKSADYLAYSRIRDACSSVRNIMTLILNEKMDDALVVLPDPIKDVALRIQEGVRQLFTQYVETYASLYAKVSAECSEPHGSREHRKVFATTAKASGIWFEPAMLQYSGQIKTPSEFVVTRRLDNGEYPNGFLDYMLERSLGPKWEAKIEQWQAQWTTDT